MTAEQVLVALGEIDESLTEVCEKTFPKQYAVKEPRRINPTFLKSILVAAAYFAVIIVSAPFVIKFIAPPRSSGTAEESGYAVTEATTAFAASSERTNAPDEAHNQAAEQTKTQTQAQAQSPAATTGASKTTTTTSTSSPPT